MKRICLTIALLTCLAVPAMAQNTGDTALGQRLVSDIFADLKAGRADAVAARLAPGFQSAHQDGARLRDAEASLLRSLSVGDYELDDFTVTRQGDTLIVSYTVGVAETIDAARLSKTKAWRLSVFVLQDDRWLWAAHANLRPLSR